MALKFEVDEADKSSKLTYRSPTIISGEAQTATHSVKSSDSPTNEDVTSEEPGQEITSTIRSREQPWICTACTSNDFINDINLNIIIFFAITR